MQHNEISLHYCLWNELSIVEYVDSCITINLQESTAKDIRKISAQISQLTGYHWDIKIDNDRKGTIYGISHQVQLERRNSELLSHEFTRKIIEVFPELKIDDIKVG